MKLETTKLSHRDWIAAVPLTVLMWATRSHHFGSMLHLPDASWAAFFIAGVMGTRIRVALWLMVNAGVIDYLALLGGVSSYCVTPAYVFLIPTYLTLWASGRWAHVSFAWDWQSLVKSGVALCAGVVGAFIISNASFYALAGYFKDMPALQFTNSVVVYLPHFLQSTAMYCVVAALVAFVWQHASNLINARIANR
jgi:hypothetical protein